MVRIIYCYNCQTEVETSRGVCPECGEDLGIDEEEKDKEEDEINWNDEEWEDDSWGKDGD